MPEVTMPRLSDTMEEGTITRWLKKSGDQVKKGDTLAEVETDKATMEIEAYDSGVLENILVQEGVTAPIGQPIAVIGTGQGAKKEAQTATTVVTTKDVKAEPAAESAQAPGPSAESTASTDKAPAKDATASGRVSGEGAETLMGENGARLRISPIARRMAEEHSIDVRQVRGTGPGGRIVRDDIEDFLEQRQAQPQQQAAPPSAEAAAAPAQEKGQAPLGVQETQLADVEAVPFSQMQKTVARRLTESKQLIPHFYVSNEIDMTNVLSLRQTLNANAGEGGVKISVNDLIVKAAALALEKFPEVNSSYKDGQALRHKNINVGIAVDIPAGLVVPVIRNTNSKGVRSIARESKALIEKAKANKLTLNDMSGGTFSVSNLGMMGVSEFVAVINPPEAAILAVAATRKQFIPVNDQPVLRDIMRVTLSADHRLIYGATVARFLQEVKRLLENPYDLLG